VTDVGPDKLAPMAGVRTLVIITAMTACACSSPTEPSATALTLPLTSSAWETISTPQPLPMSNQNGALTFDFPVTGSGSMHYLFTASPLLALRGTLAVTLRVATNGPVLFNLVDPGNCGIPPSVRPLIWANENGTGDYDRWWSNPRHFALGPGTTTIAVPLEPSSWSSVNGQVGNANARVQFGFEKALLNVSRLGLTFGGGCSFGHGISVSGGAATFTLSEYVIR